MSASINKSTSSFGADDGGYGGAEGDSLCGVIMRFMTAIPFVANGQSVISGRIVRQLYKYFFLRVIKIYAYFITNPNGKINVNVSIGGAVRATTGTGVKSAAASAAVSAMLLDSSRLTTPIQAAQDALSTRSSLIHTAIMAGSEQSRMRDLLLTIIQLLLRNKREVNKTVDHVMQLTNKMKRRETEQMRSKFKLMSADRRAIANELKNLRLGDWNVGSRKGFTQYDKATYDRESRERAIEADVETETMNDMREDAAAGTSALALVHTNYDNGFGPEQLDEANAEAVDFGVGGTGDGYKMLGQLDGDDFDRDQAMRNESGISTTCH